jgi:uncharacterized protein (DUF1778 family)
VARDTRGAVVSVRLSDEQQDQLRRLAEARGKSVSDLIRTFVAEEMKPVARGTTVSAAGNGTGVMVASLDSDAVASAGTGFVRWDYDPEQGDAVGTTLTVRMNTLPGREF